MTKRIDFMKSELTYCDEKMDAVWMVFAVTSPICAVDIAASTPLSGVVIMQLKTSSKGLPVARWSTVTPTLLRNSGPLRDSETGEKLLGEAAVARCIELGKNV
jgi:hypothetical protein